MAYVSHVRKRDGRLVRFEPARLVRSIVSAAVACGYDAFYAEEMADAVITHLREREDNTPPDTDAVAAAVETVLHATNHHEVAAQYEAYREQRKQHREKCTVVKSQQPSLLNAAESLHVTYSSGARTSAWDRSKLIHALHREASLPREAAESVARAVEEKILTSDIHRVTTTLIRALTDNELLVRGYSAALRQQSSATVPFADIEHLLKEKPSHVTREIGAQVVQPYVLSHVFSDDVATAHQRGVLHLSGLGFPGSMHSVTYPLIKAGESARERRTRFSEICSAIRDGRIARVYIKADENFNDAKILLEFIDYAATLPPYSCVICYPAEIIEKIAFVLKDVSPTSSVEQMCVGEGDKITSLVRMAAQGWRTGWMPSLPPAIFSQRISLNIPQAVYRARQQDLDGVIEEIYRSIEVAAQAHHQYVHYTQDHFEELPDRHAALIECVGLYEAVAILTGTGVFEPSEGIPCARVVLNVIAHGLRQMSDTYNSTLMLTAGEPDVCGKRFSAIDQSLFPEIFGYLPLSPEKLEPIIPSYSILERHIEKDTDTHACAERAQQIMKFFSAGVLPCHFFDVAQDEVTACIESLPEMNIPFRIDLLRSDAREERTHDSESDLPGLHSAVGLL